MSEEIKTKKIMMELADGTTMVCEGEEAQKWAKALDGAMAMAAAHGFVFPEILWDVKNGTAADPKEGPRQIDCPGGCGKPIYAFEGMCRFCFAKDKPRGLQLRAEYRAGRL